MGVYDDMTVVSIDDSEQNLMLVEAYAEEIGIKNIKSYLNPLEALEFILKTDIDMIFVDYMMPNLNGVDLIEKYREYNSETPVIMITAAGEDMELKFEALHKGATDFLSKPLDFVEFSARVKNLLELRIAQIKLKNRALLLEDEVKKATQKIVQREHEALVVLSKTAEYKDPETASHVARVAHYSKLMAKSCGLSDEEQEIIFYASPFHDIGKVGINDSILLKPAKLSDEEFKQMKQHALIGYDILKESKSKFLKEGALIALSHHEKYDGSGYPNGLRGEDIPLSGRVVAIADVFDALTSKRPYKEAWSFEKAKNLLIQESGKHFDPNLVKLFFQNIDKIRDIYKNFKV